VFSLSQSASSFLKSWLRDSSRFRSSARTARILSIALDGDNYMCAATTITSVHPNLGPDPGIHAPELVVGRGGHIAKDQRHPSEDADGRKEQDREDHKGRPKGGSTSEHGGKVSVSGNVAFGDGQAPRLEDSDRSIRGSLGKRNSRPGKRGTGAGGKDAVRTPDLDPSGTIRAGPASDSSNGGCTTGGLSAVRRKR